MLRQLQPFMRRSVTSVGGTAAVFVLLLGCGGESGSSGSGESVTAQAANAVNAAKAVGQMAGMGSRLEASSEEAAKFQAERRARGDTVAMSYTALQAMLPDAPAGYTKDGEPDASSQSMSGFSMTEATQRYKGEAAADGSAPRITVKLVDFGGTEGAYALMAMPMMLDMKQEDARRRTGSVTLGPAHTWAMEEFDKRDNDVTVTAVTRYRYLVTVKASRQSGDNSAMVRSFTEQVVRRFDGK